MSIIEVQNLTKVFKGVIAVDHISFEVEEQEIFGFLGPSRAGKTTRMKMLTTQIKPSEGRGNVAGIEVLKKPDQVRKSLALCPSS